MERKTVRFHNIFISHQGYVRRRMKTSRRQKKKERERERFAGSNCDGDFEMKFDVICLKKA